MNSTSLAFTPSRNALLALLGRFGLVGILNTLLDMAATNLLFLILRPTSAAQITLITLIAGSIATVNSYYCNAKWTFGDAQRDTYRPLRFVCFAAIGLATQAAVSLFAGYWLLRNATDVSLWMMNVAKLAAVAAAAGVTLVGYRIAVFTPDSLRTFREGYALGDFEPSALRQDLVRHIASLMALAAAARLIFLWLAPVAYGDAVNYSWVAWLTAHGLAAQADTFWHSAYDYWQLLFAGSGLSQYAAMVAASFVPGTLLVIPGYLLTRRLYGSTAALIAGCVLALHPRLIEYSVNGYAESFFLHWALWMIWALTVYVRYPRHRIAALLAGGSAALWFLCRNEAVIAILAIGATAMFAQWLGSRRLHLLPLLLAALAFAALVAGMIGTDRLMYGHSSLFSKGSNLSRNHIEMLDPAAAARETYGTAGSGAARAPATISQTAQKLLARWPDNIMYTLQRLPGMLLSPLFMLALLLPAFCRRRGSVRGEEWPLLLFTIWPLLFYPFLQLEPRMLFPLVIGVAIFGAAALVALSDWLSARLRWERMRAVAAALAILALLPPSLTLARHTQAERGMHRQIGAWLANNVPSGTELSGDGYGYITTSAFWAQRRATPRIWSADAASLGTWLNERAPAVLVIYESYLRTSNPELLAVLEHGLPHAARIKEFRFAGQGRVQIYAPTSVKPASYRVAPANISAQPAS